MFCTFQDGICVVWVCFVPLWISFVFLCFRGVQLEAHRTFFTTKMSQNLYCVPLCVPLVAHHEWESFVPLKLFYTSWWVSFVPFRTVFVWCGFVSYHCQWQYTLCTVFKSIHIPLEPHSTFFTTNNGSKIVLCAISCRPQMDLFCTIETFFVPQSDSIPHFMFQGSHTSQEGLKQVSTSSHI